MLYVAPSIIIRIRNTNVKVLYNIDFDHFKNEIEQLPGVSIAESLCFDDNTLLIGLEVNCDTINFITIVKRFKNFFTNRWQISDSEITTELENTVPLIDYVYN